MVEPPVEAPVEVEEPVAPPLERPEPTAGRLTRLRARLARSESALGRGLLGLLSRDRLEEEACAVFLEELRMAASAFA